MGGPHCWKKQNTIGHRQSQIRVIIIIHNRNKVPSSNKTKDLNQKHNAVEGFIELDKSIVHAGASITPSSGTMGEPEVTSLTMIAIHLMNGLP